MIDGISETTVFSRRELYRHYIEVECTIRTFKNHQYVQVWPLKRLFDAYGALQFSCNFPGTYEYNIQRLHHFFHVHPKWRRLNLEQALRRSSAFLWHCATEAWSKRRLYEQRKNPNSGRQLQSLCTTSRVACMQFKAHQNANWAKERPYQIILLILPASLLTFPPHAVS